MSWRVRFSLVAPYRVRGRAMPEYTFSCLSCGKRADVVLRMADYEDYVRRLPQCECGGEFVREYGVPQVIDDSTAAHRMASLPKLEGDGIGYPTFDSKSAKRRYVGELNSRKEGFGLVLD